MKYYNSLPIVFSNNFKYKNILFVDVTAPYTDVCLEMHNRGFNVKRLGLTTQKYYIDKMKASGFYDLYKDSVENKTINKIPYYNYQDFKNFNDVVKFFKGKVDLIVSGNELGVSLCEKLQIALNTLSNNEKTMLARRDKYETQKELKNNNLEHKKYILTKNVDDAISFFNKMNQKKIVVKERLGMGASNVYICSNTEQIKTNFNLILNTPNIVQEKNNDVMVEEFIVGDEYTANCISKNGKHKLISLYKRGERNKNGLNPSLFGNVELVTSLNGINIEYI